MFLGRVLIGIMSLVIINSCKSQKILNTKVEKFGWDSVVESIWVPSKNFEEYKFKYQDTAIGEINLVFEMQFDDSIQITLNSKPIASKRIKTKANLSVVEDVFSINYKTEDSLITVYSVDKKRKASFRPKEGYLFGYINRVDTLWAVEYSNYQRMYY